MSFESKTPAILEAMTAVGPLQLRHVDAPVNAPVLAYLGQLHSTRSRRVMRSALLQVARLLGYERIEDTPWCLLTRPVVAAILTLLESEVDAHERPRYAPATLNRILTGLKGVAKEGRYLGQISPDEYQGIKDLKGVKGSRLPRGRALSQEEAALFLAACDDDQRIQGVRDKALFALLFGSGMRRSEVVSLNIGNLDAKEQACTVIGKGNKERVVDMTPRAWAYLNEWLAVRGDSPGPVFVRIMKNNQMTDKRLTDQAVYYLTKQISAKAGLEKMSPHDLRRSFVTWMLEGGTDIALVAKMVDHEDLRTTQKYDKRDRLVLQKQLRGQTF